MLTKGVIMSFLDLTTTPDSDVLPAGKYAAICEQVERRDSKSGGEYLNVKFKLIDPVQSGVVFTMFNTKNANVKAVEIGHQQLKAFMTASGKTDFVIKSISDLEGLKCMIKTRVVEDSWGIKAQITSYSKIEGELPQSEGPSTQTFTQDEIPF